MEAAAADKEIRPGIDCDVEHMKALGAVVEAMLLRTPAVSRRTGRWSGDGMPENNLDPDYLGMRDLTSFCTVCNRIRPGEQICRT